MPNVTTPLNPARKYSGNTKILLISGKLSWHNLSIPTTEGEWKCTIYPNADGLIEINKLKEEGLLNGLRKDDEGYNMTFKRVQKKKIKGNEVTFTAPVVVDKDGKPLDGMGLGHGSDCTIKLQVYRYNKPGMTGVKGTAARLEAVRIDNLVPFKPRTEFTTEQAFQLKGLADFNSDEAIF